jgi:hypothetical protein
VGVTTITLSLLVDTSLLECVRSKSKPWSWQAHEKVILIKSFCQVMSVLDLLLFYFLNHPWIRVFS